MKKFVPLFLLLALLMACAPQTAETPAAPGMGMGMGGNGMMARHHATIPEAYFGLSNPVSADEASLERGKSLYTANCASCHGDGGMGDGPAGAALDPAPAPVAHTSQMMADDYLFWRVSEGGAEFGTTMPGWKAFDEQSRWDMINYMRALGAGKVTPGQGMGGAAYNPELQAARQAELLAEAVKLGVISQDEADTFKLVHDALEQYQLDHPEIRNSSGNATERETAVLAALVEANAITQAQADNFREIHDKLGNAGLMP